MLSAGEIVRLNHSGAGDLVRLPEHFTVPPLLRGHYAEVMGHDGDGGGRVHVYTWTHGAVRLAVPENWLLKLTPDEAARLWFAVTRKPPYFTAPAEELQENLATLQGALRRLGVAKTPTEIWSAESFTRILHPQVKLDDEAYRAAQSRAHRAWLSFVMAAKTMHQTVLQHIE